MEDGGGGNTVAGKDFDAYMGSLSRDDRVACYMRATSHHMAGVLTPAEKDAAMEALSSLPVAQALSVSVAQPDGTRTSVDVATHDSILALKGKIEAATDHRVKRQQLFLAGGGEDPIANELLVGSLLPPLRPGDQNGASAAAQASLELFLLLAAADPPLTGTMCVRVLSEDGASRLDIGSASVYRECSASHESWATRLTIRRLDGPSDGPVCAGHLVGFFGGGKRLDLGPDSMRAVCPPQRESWGTRLHIRPLLPPAVPASGASSSSSGALSGAEAALEMSTVKYGELVGVFSADGTKLKRLDIGSASVREVGDGTDTCTTRLRIQEVV
jgi:hypothetical protein